MPGSAFREAEERRRRRQQGDRALQRHRHLCRQGHRLSALEIRPARQGFLLPPVAYLSGWPRGLGSTDQPQTGQHASFGGRPRGVQRDRLAPVLFTGCGRGRPARAELSTEQADNSVHFSYEMVALSPRTCVELGIELRKKTSKRPYVEVSGRKGLGVKADDLIDKLIEKALEEVTSRHADEPESSRDASPRRSPSARCATSC